MKIMVLSTSNMTAFNFRGDLIKEFIKCGYDVVVTGPDQQYVEEIKNLGASFIEIPVINNQVGIRGDLEYCAKLQEIIAKERPDKIFCYMIKPVVYGSIAANRCGISEIYAMIPGLGRIYTGDGIKTKVLRIITGILYKYSLRYCKKVIFQNWDDLNLFLKMRYVKKEQCEKIDGSGVNMERFVCTELINNKTFLMTARIIREKGVYEFCEAARIVKQKHADARFILLGGYDNSIGGIQEEGLKQYLENKTIEIPGETKDVVPILTQSYCFVLPTYYREGIPRSILEAMACGKPVITTDWVGTREAVEDGRNGYLVPIKNVDALAEKMIELIENPDLAKKMGEESFKICKKKFDVNIINEKMINIMSVKALK